MENVVKEAVERYMSQRPQQTNSQRNRCMPLQSSPSSTPLSPTNPTRSGDKTERKAARLGTLLNRIRNNTGSNNKSVKYSSCTKTKRIQIKWQRYCSEDDKYKLVRIQNGGGVRFPEIQLGLCFWDIKHKSIDLFYDNEGYNWYGENSFDCIFSICNASGVEIYDEETVTEYLAKKGVVLSKTYFVLKSRYFSMEDLPSALFSTEKPLQQPLETLASDSYCLPSAMFDNDDDSKFLETVPLKSICPVCSHTMDSPDVCLICHQNEEFAQSSAIDLAAASNVNNDSASTHSSSATISSLNTFVDGEEAAVTSTTTEELSTDVLRSRRLAHFISDPQLQHDGELKIVRIRRSRIREDLLQEFKHGKITFSDEVRYIFVDPRGQDENGIGIGVSRDVYSSFWAEVADCYLIGQDERIPMVRHDLYIEEWEAMGKLLVKGFSDTGYFPTVLSYCFIKYCIFEEVTDEDLVNSFLRYIASDERALVEQMLASDPEEEVFSSDEVLEFLDQFKCRSLLTKENANAVLFELARQELIQKPHLMISCWKKYLVLLKDNVEFSTTTKLKDFYESSVPTCKKVIQLLTAQPNDEAERESFGYFKRYIRGLDNSQLKKLLKFLTGSEIIIVRSIHVSFTRNQNQFSRHPTAHTCGPNLELPATYTNPCELREEFASILQHSNWEMDVV